jgi:hypothetical protein
VTTGREIVHKIISICVTLIAVACSVSPSTGDFYLLHAERIGDFRIGLSETEFKNITQCPLKRGSELLWGADGAYHQEWEYVGCGITLGMVSVEEGATKLIESIAVTAPSSLTTKRGIGIGSAEQEVMSAYKPYWNREESGPGSFVAGSIYGGLMFDLEGGLVTRIFLGAAAE